MSTLKIYEFDVFGDWVIAENSDEAVKYLENEMGCRIADHVKPRELPEEELRTMFILDKSDHYEDEDIPEEEADQYRNGYRIQTNFAVELKKGIKGYLAGRDE